MLDLGQWLFDMPTLDCTAWLYVMCFGHWFVVSSCPQFKSLFIWKYLATKPSNWVMVLCTNANQDANDGVWPQQWLHCYDKSVWKWTPCLLFVVTLVNKETYLSWLLAEITWLNLRCCSSQARRWNTGSRRSLHTWKEREVLRERMPSVQSKKKTGIDSSTKPSLGTCSL